MNQTLLSDFGTPVERVERAIDALRNGRGVMVLDDESRENEGDMVFCCRSNDARANGSDHPPR